MSILNQLIQFIAKISLGKELALAMTVLKMLADAITKKEVDDLSVFVYNKLPAEWRHPEGPATEKEFVAAIKSGEDFIKRILALTSK